MSKNFTMLGKLAPILLYINVIVSIFENVLLGLTMYTSMHKLIKVFDISIDIFILYSMESSKIRSQVHDASYVSECIPYNNSIQSDPRLCRKEDCHCKMQVLLWRDKELP